MFLDISWLNGFIRLDVDGDKPWDTKKNLREFNLFLFCSDLFILCRRDKIESLSFLQNDFKNSF